MWEKEGTIFSYLFNLCLNYFLHQFYLIFPCLKLLPGLVSVFLFMWWSRRELCSLGQDWNWSWWKWGLTCFYVVFLKMTQPRHWDMFIPKQTDVSDMGRDLEIFLCLFTIPRISLKSLFPFNVRLKDFVWRKLFGMQILLDICEKKNNMFYRKQERRYLFTKHIFCQNCILMRALHCYIRPSKNVLFLLVYSNTADLFLLHIYFILLAI